MINENTDWAIPFYQNLSKGIGGGCSQTVVDLFSHPTPGHWQFFVTGVIEMIRTRPQYKALDGFLQVLIACYQGHENLDVNKANGLIKQIHRELVSYASWNMRKASYLQRQIDLIMCLGKGLTGKKQLDLEKLCTILGEDAYWLRYREPNQPQYYKAVERDCIRAKKAVLSEIREILISSAK